MRKTRLILLDGLPGSGKTTTARTLTAWLRTHHLQAECLEEVAAPGQEHPLNVGGPLHPAGATPGAPLFAQYTVDAYIQESLARWQAFVRAAAQAQSIFVVDSYPYQNAARILLQLNADLDRIRTYTGEVEQLLAPLRPVLIYFDHPDASAALQTIAAQRGPQWTAYAAELIIDCPYARERGLHGVDGALVVMGAYKRMLDEFVATTRMPVAVLQPCAGRWAACLQHIQQFLQV